MSDLKASVKAAITSFVQSKNETHTQADVLRMIRDQAALLFERQAICDALDADPMQQLDEVTAQTKRIQSLMEVTSCSRVVTLDGYTRNDAVVEWKRDDRMKDVSSNVQLTFHYERRRKSENQNESRILYTIDVAKDYGPRERLLVIEVFALGEQPSATPAEPLDEEEEEWEDIDENDEGEAMEAEVVQVESVKQGEDKQAQEKECDRYAAYLDPDVLSDFLEWTQLGMDEVTTFFFLMTFPFYEHEWDLVGFVLDIVFGDSMDEDEEEAMSQEAVQDGEAMIQEAEQDDNKDDDSDL